MHNVEPHTPAFVFPLPSESVRSFPLEQPRERPETPSSSSLYNLTESTSTLDARPSQPPWQSNLSILLARHSRSPSRERAAEEEGDTHTPIVSQPTPTLHRPQQHTLLPSPCPAVSPRSLTERTPLLPFRSFPATHYTSHKWVARAKSTMTEVARSLPAVILGLLLNILDGISCTSHFAFRCVHRSFFRSSDHFHVIYRRHDNLSCHGRLY